MNEMLMLRPPCPCDVSLLYVLNQHGEARDEINAERRSALAAGEANSLRGGGSRGRSPALSGAASRQNPRRIGWAIFVFSRRTKAIFRIFSSVTISYGAPNAPRRDGAAFRTLL
jgi:hypothetical protein